MSTSSNAPIGCVLTAMITPFTSDGAVDFASAERLAVQLVAEGNDGLCISGTTGEAPTTTDQEKIDLLKAVRSAVGDNVTLLAGVGGNETAHVIRSAKDAAAAGADAVLAVTPYYNKPPQSGVYAHFIAVADSTGLPVVLYDIPGRVGIQIETSTLQRLGEHDRIVAVKDAKADLFAGSEVMATTNLVYYSGDDALNLAWLAHGGAGMISVVGHGFSADYAAMVAAVDRGDLPAAQAIHTKLIPAIKAIMAKESQGAIRAKALSYARGLIDSPMTRLPLLPATAAETEEMMTVLSECGLRPDTDSASMGRTA